MTTPIPALPRFSGTHRLLTVMADTPENRAGEIKRMQEADKRAAASYRATPGVTLLSEEYGDTFSMREIKIEPTQDSPTEGVLRFERRIFGQDGRIVNEFRVTGTADLVRGWDSVLIRTYMQEAVSMNAAIVAEKGWDAPHFQYHYTP